MKVSAVCLKGNQVPSAGKDDGNNTRIVIAVVVPVAVCLVLAVSAIFLVRKKKKQKPMEDPESKYLILLS